MRNRIPNSLPTRFPELLDLAISFVQTESAAGRGRDQQDDPEHEDLTRVLKGSVLGRFV
jgi:hypothetical protein